MRNLIELLNTVGVEVWFSPDGIMVVNEHYA